MDVIEGVKIFGQVNTDDSVLQDHIRYAIRQNHPQIWRQPENMDRVALVGSGPSIHETEAELVDLIHNQGAKLVTLNGAFEWALNRNLKPSAQIVLDARPSTARFVRTYIPSCRYYIASQCHPDVWKTVADYQYVGIWHAVASEESPLRAILDDYYVGHWMGIPGGTSVATRAIGLLRTLGYLRYDIFGVDSCWLEGQHHAVEQPENEQDRRITFDVFPTGQRELATAFDVAPWHIAQFQDILQIIRFSGSKFLLNFHGRGLVAHAFRMLQAGIDTTGSIQGVAPPTG